MTGAGANGGQRGTSGGAPLSPRFGLALLVATMAVQGAVNALSGIEDRRALGDATPAWAVWTWEATSMAVWLMLVPVIAFAVAWLRPPMLRLPLALAAHLALNVVVSVVHVTGMLALRWTVYRLAGANYPLPHDLAAVLVYEYRKDAVTYTIIAASLTLIAWLTRRAVAKPEAQADAPAILIVQNGTRRHHIAYNAIEYVQAAGNYVEVASGGAMLLHRATLGAMEAQLTAHGFVRIHRSRLVRRAAIRTVVSNDNGDFDVTLTSGAVLRGSRRFRDEV